MDGRGTILLPIAHSTQNAQIEVRLNLKGEFQGAVKVEKPQAVTIIPVTEDSASRSSGIAPHPLCDKLCYIAGDYQNYYAKKKIEEYYRAYMEQLETWYQSGCHRAVGAIHDYLIKGKLIQDLTEAQILVLNEAGKLDEKVKLDGISQADAFVRFRILDGAYEGTGDIWNDPKVYDDYVQYYLSKMDKMDLDYITGAYTACSEKQPSKIRNSGDKAKLISANDSSGFTYRGRFRTKEEALSVGYISSQEAHNALRWLIQRQGYRKYGMCMVTWNAADNKVPEWEKGTYEMLFEEEEAEEFLADAGEEYAIKIKQAISGKYQEIENPAENVMVIGLDAATPGRLSVVYYRQMKGSEFLERILNWHTTCTWYLGYLKGMNKTPTAPKPEDIVYAAYGNERNKLLTVDDKLMKDTLGRLVPCIIDGADIPLDIVRAAVGNASRPQAFTPYNQRKILDVTCALIHKKYEDGKGRKKMLLKDLKLQRECDDRDYLYGRLLAVANKLESDTFAESEKGKRETNATRYTSMMVKNPTKTWKVIVQRLEPYKKKLNPGSRVLYEKEFQQIYDLFSTETFHKPGTLGELYILGYNQETSYLWKNQKKTNEGED